MPDILNELLDQEKQLQFKVFNEATAWKLGKSLYDLALKDNLAITIDITKGSHQLFHAALPGTSADNDEWVKRKTRAVYRFGHSSYYLGQSLKAQGKTMEQAYLVPESEYGAHGGCFPIMVTGTGMVGTVTVSGLAQKDDHDLVVKALKIILKKG